MAKLPTVKSLLVEDISKDAPVWFQNFLIPLNSFMSSVYYALDKDISFTDNIASSIKEISFTTRTDYLTASPLTTGWVVLEIFNPLKKKPVGVSLVAITDNTNYEVITSSVHIDWIYLSGYIKIRYVTGLKASNKYTLTLLIF